MGKAGVQVRGLCWGCPGAWGALKGPQSPISPPGMEGEEHTEKEAVESVGRAWGGPHCPEAGALKAPGPGQGRDQETWGDGRQPTLCPQGLPVSLCLSTGPRSPVLETPVPHRREGSWLSPTEKDSARGALGACIHFVVYLMVINVFATKWKKANRM